MRPRAGIDLDGVVHQWSPTARRILERQFGLEISESQTYDWIQNECARLGRPDAWTWMWKNAVPEMFSGPPYPGAVEVLRELSETYDLVVASRRPRGAITATYRWLGEHGVPASTIFLLHDKQPKADFWRGCEWCVEDSPAEATALQDAGGVGKIFLLDRPWNQECVAGERIVDLSEITGRIKTPGG